MAFGTVEADPGTGGATFAVDLIAGVTHPRTKLSWGAEGTATTVAAGGGALPIQDGGNSITVDGAVSIAAAIPAGTNNIGDVDVLSLPAIPAGNNNIGDVDIASIAAGNNNIGDVDIASIAAGNNNIGNVDVETFPAAESTKLTNIESHVSRLTTSTGPQAPGAPTGSTATVIAGMYNATPPTFADGNAGAFQLDANGALKVSGGGGGVQYTEGDADATILGTALMWEDTSDTLRAVSAVKPLPVNIVAGAGSGGTASTDDAAFTPAVGSGTPMMGLVTADAVDSGDVGVIAILANRQQKVTLYDSAGAEIAVGGGTQYDEDTAHVSGDKVTMAGVVRSDTASAKATTDGDRSVLISDASGRLHVNVGATVSTPVTNAGTFVTQENGAALTALQLLDDTVKTDDAAFTPATDKVLMIGAQADETTPDAVNEGDAGALRMTLNRAMHVNLRAADGTELTAAQDATHDSAALTVGPQAMGVAGTTAPTNVTAGDAVRLWALLNGTLAVNLRDSSGNEVSASGGTQYDEDTAHVSGDKVTMAGVVRSDTASAKATTDGDRSVLISDASGRLHVNVGASVSTPVTNAGTFVTQENGALLTAAQLLDDTIVADDAAFTIGTTKVSVGGFIADETATDSVDEGDAGAARMTLDRRQIVVPQPHSAGGLSTHRSIDLDEGTLEVVKASPGCLYGMWVSNLSTTTRFIKFYDATSGTYGTGTPKLTIPIPGNATDDISGAFGPGGVGIDFTTGICVGAGTGVADADTGAPGANDVIVNIFFK